MMRYHLRPLREQVMVITGGSSGIGLDTAKMAAAAGAQVVLVARDEEALTGAVQEIEAGGGIAAFAVAAAVVATQVPGGRGLAAIAARRARLPGKRRYRAG